MTFPDIDGVKAWLSNAFAIIYVPNQWYLNVFTCNDEVKRQEFNAYLRAMTQKCESLKSLRNLITTPRVIVIYCYLRPSVNNIYSIPYSKCGSALYLLAFSSNKRWCYKSMTFENYEPAGISSNLWSYSFASSGHILVTLQNIQFHCKQMVRLLWCN